MSKTQDARRENWRQLISEQPRSVHRTGDGSDAGKFEERCVGPRASAEQDRLDDRDYLVEEILDQWYGPDGAFFKVRADDRNLYILRRNTHCDEWTLESFRQVKD